MINRHKDLFADGLFYINIVWLGRSGPSIPYYPEY